MSSATSLVFSTPELLELILLQLPIPSILLCRRMSSTFNCIIISSPALQQKLFFRSSPAPTLKEWHANPLLRKHFLPFFDAPEGRFSSRDYSVLKMLDWTHNAATREAFLRKEASWRNMALISHAPASLRVVRWIHGQIGSSEDIAHIPFDSKSGVTMGVIYDIVHSFLVNNLVASFGVAFTQSSSSHESGTVGMTLYLNMTVQCCVDESDDEEATILRSEGEKVTVYGLEWKTRKEWTLDDMDLAYIPDMWDEWKSDLDCDKGGLDEGEWKEWKEWKSLRGK